MTMVVEELYRLYTERFTHTDAERNEDGVLVPVTYRPQSVCSEEEVRECWNTTATRSQPPFFWPNSTARLNAALDAMRSKLGAPGHRKGRAG